MNITEFNRILTEAEGKKVSISIAQINEIIKLTNELTNGELYKLIRKIDLPTTGKIKTMEVKKFKNATGKTVRPSSGKK